MHEYKRKRVEKHFLSYQQRKEKIVAGNANIKGIRWRRTIRPVLREILKLLRKLNGQTIEVISGEIPQSNRPIIYAATHIGKSDFEIINEILPEHFHVLAADYLNMFGNINGLFMWATGVVFINEESKRDRKNTKLVMIKLLNQGDNILIFPEAAWNLSENEIIRDTHFGTVECAIKTGAVIIPIAIEQYKKRFVINIGDVLDPAELTKAYELGTDKKYSDCDEQEKRELYYEQINRTMRDAMATLKYEIWEREEITKRNELPENYWEDFLEERMKEWKGYEMEGQIINGCFPKEKREWIQVQQTLAKLNPNWWRCCWIVRDI